MAQQKRPNNGKKPNRANEQNRPRNAGSASADMSRPGSGRAPSSAQKRKPSDPNKNAPSSKTAAAGNKNAQNKKQVQKNRPDRNVPNKNVQNRKGGPRPNTNGSRPKPNQQLPVLDPKSAIKRVPAFGDEDIIQENNELMNSSAAAGSAERSSSEMNSGKKTSRNKKKGGFFSRKDKKDKTEENEADSAKTKQTEKAPVLEVVDPNEERRKHMAKRRKKETLMASFNSFLCVMILIGVMIIAVLYVVDYVAAKPTYAFATEGSIEHTIGATAIIVRNETVVDSSHTGSLLTQATEGSRVAKNQLLAMVIPDGMESTVSELRSVEQQIVDIERELMAQGKGIGAKAIFSDIDGEIAPIISMVRQDAILGNLSNMTSYSSSIRVLMEKRDVELENIDFDDEKLNSLREREAALQTQLETNAASIYAMSTGIVSYKLDGLENQVSYTLLMSMMDNQLQNLLKDCSSIITGDLQIEASEPVLRIVQNDVQYFACIIDGSSVNEFAENSEHVIRIPSEGISIPECKVIRSFPVDNGVMVVFSTPNQVERLLDRRSVNIEIVQTKTTGIRVPISTLVDPDYERGIATIYVNQSGYARGYTVKISDYDREYAIIDAIDGGFVPDTSTIVITNPNTVKEGDKVEK